MPIKFLGFPDPKAKGKFLFEILAQLRNMGVGRLITKGEWQHMFPTQPSYVLVRKVEPQMDRWLAFGKVWGEWIYRGKNLGVYCFDDAQNRSDWLLVHKRDEQNFKRCEQPFTTRKLPSAIPLPPLQRFILQQKLKAKGKDPAVDLPMIPYVLNIDPEFEMLEKHTEYLPELNVSPTGSVYDVDPQIYLDQFGDEPLDKVTQWGDTRYQNVGRDFSYVYPCAGVRDQKLGVPNKTWLVPTPFRPPKRKRPRIRPVSGAPKRYADLPGATGYPF